MRSWPPYSYWKWTFLFLLSFGTLSGILVVVGGLVLGVPARSWGFPYLLLLGCGFVAACLTYWARQSYDKPKSGAIRFALAVFLILNLCLGALLVGAVKVGILSSSSVLSENSPYILLASLLGSVSAYVMARKRLGAWKRE